MITFKTFRENINNVAVGGRNPINNARSKTHKHEVETSRLLRRPEKIIKSIRNKKTYQGNK